MPFVRVAKGDDLHYLDVGRGPTCVLLHGFGMQAAHFLPFVLPLARRHRFILLDQRGFGGSRRLPLRDPDLLLSHAQDLSDVLEALHLDRPALGGISMGAAASLAYLRHYGFEKVRSYVHIDQSPRVLNDATYRSGVFGEEQARIFATWTVMRSELEACGRDTPYARIPKALRCAFAEMLAEFFEFACYRRILRASTAIVRIERVANQFLEPDDWPLYLDAMKAYQTCDYDFRPDLRQVSVPMRVFVGMQSRMYPPEGQLEIRDYVPHAQIVRFEETGHVVLLEAPVRFTRALGSFLEAA